MRIFEFTGHQISPQQLRDLEVYVDRLFSAVGLDIEFTRHFKDRMNDERNRDPITVTEIQRMFKKVHRQMRKGKDLIELGADAEAVLKDLASNLNIPFVIKWDAGSQEFDLITKTIMRKPNFTSPDNILTVQ